MWVPADKPGSRDLAVIDVGSNSVRLVLYRVEGRAIWTIFNVKVLDVNTLVMRGKDRRMGRGYAKLQNWKKAIITLKEGDSIDFFGDNASA